MRALDSLNKLFFPLFSDLGDQCYTFSLCRIKDLPPLLNGGRGATVGRTLQGPGVPWWFEPLLGAKACDWSRKRDGGKSLIKQIISCWGREQLHFRAPLLECWKPPPLNFHALRAQSPLHRRRVSSGCGRAQSHRHPPPHMSGCSCIWRSSTTFLSSLRTWGAAAAGKSQTLLKFIYFYLDWTDDNVDFTAGMIYVQLYTQKELFVSPNVDLLFIGVMETIWKTLCPQNNT